MTAVRNQRAEINHRDSKFAELLLCALYASVGEIDLRVLISGSCALLARRSGAADEGSPNKLLRASLSCFNLYYVTPVLFVRAAQNFFTICLILDRNLSRLSIG